MATLADNKIESSDIAHVTLEKASSTVPETKRFADNSHNDAGLDAYQQALDMDPDHLEALGKKVIRKLDFILLPLMCTIYLTGFLEKFALNYANAYNFQADLGLHGRQYAWAAAIVNLGVMVGSYPASLAVQKLPVGRLISCLLLIWGALSMSVAAVTNFRTLVALRLILGISEAAIGPAWISMTSMFWTREEQPLRMCFWLGCNGIAQMLGAGISTGLGKVTHTAVSPWQLIFLVLGALAVVLGIVAIFLLPNGPSDARFLTPDERIACVWRIANNQTGIEHRKMLKYQAIEAVLDIRVWFLLVQQFSIGFFNGALSNYFSAFLRGFGWSSLDAVKYQLPIGAVQITSTVFAGYLASRFRNTTTIIVLVIVVFPIVALIGWSTISSEHKMALTACSWIVAFYGPAVILNWSLVAANFAGHTKRTVVNGVNFAAFYAGNFAGPFVFTPSEAPRYFTATRILGGFLGIIWLMSAGIGFVMWRENRRRNAKALAGEVAYQPSSQGTMDGFTDRTDKENKSFRYRL